MGGLECVITGLMDEFCSFFAGKKYAREIFTACAIVVSFSVATINVTPVSVIDFWTLTLGGLNQKVILYNVRSE